ncbi:hypothetical protein CEXT_109331 [Caerostris extrusa]|uniref:Uncharacterized protein n=1 Tax=Caerostris extrusa TaxID=172846 RepID=A0AAV4X9R9_CAEEX|nr:hypothetical protein CEXT_109331 [Caerostris extrusa]
MKNTSSQFSHPRVVFRFLEMVRNGVNGFGSRRFGVKLLESSHLLKRSSIITKAHLAKKEPSTGKRYSKMKNTSPQFSHPRVVFHFLSMVRNGFNGVNGFGSRRFGGSNEDRF